MKRLSPGDVLKVEAGSTVRCCAGIVEAGGRVLRPGDAAQGPVWVKALEGMRDEWLADSGIVVVYVS